MTTTAMKAFKERVPKPVIRTAGPGMADAPTTGNCSTKDQSPGIPQSCGRRTEPIIAKVLQSEVNGVLAHKCARVGWGPRGGGGGGAAAAVFGRRSAALDVLTRPCTAGVQNPAGCWD